MDITYLGHSSFKIRGKSAGIVTDPFDSKFVGLKFPSTEAEIVTISHSHPDHNQSGLVKGVKMVVEGPGEYEICGISIIGIGTYHDDKKGSLRGKNTVYVYEVDSLRVAHLGDLGEALSDEQVSLLGNIDVLMIPVGGEYTIGPKEAVKVVSAIDPYFVIPMHYRTPNLNQENFLKLFPVTDFLAESGLPVESVSKFSLKKEDILADQSTKIILLPEK